jgi:heptosyltransferase-2
LTTPVLRAIKARWPKSHIAFLTRDRFAPVIEGNPHVDELIRVGGAADSDTIRELCANKLARPWDLLADLHGSIRSRLVWRGVAARHKVRYSNLRLNRWLLIWCRVDFYGPEPPSVPEKYAKPLEKFGVRLDENPCEIYLRDSDRAEAAKLLRAAWPRPVHYLAVAPGAAWPNKRWPAERFAEAAKKICEREQLNVVLLGGPGDEQVCEQVADGLGGVAHLNLCDKLSLRGSAAALEAASHVLTNDTGLMHMATAVGTPLTVVFGPTVKQFGYFPYRAENAKVVEADLWCRPCTHNGRKGCPLGHFKCMKGVGVEGVI